MKVGDTVKVDNDAPPGACAMFVRGYTGEITKIIKGVARIKFSDIWHTHEIKKKFLTKMNKSHS